MSRPRDQFRSTPRRSPLPGLSTEPRLRVRLDGGLTLRAFAQSWDQRGAKLGADLPWLRLGASAQVELDEGMRQGRIEWIGIEPGENGARLSIHVAFEAKKERIDQTKPYFFDDALHQEVTQEEPRLEPIPTERMLSLPSRTANSGTMMRLLIAVAIVGALIAIMGIVHR